jgi:AcrR family transcriptional regulator
VGEPGASADVVREQILAAAFDEVTHWGIERFSVQNLAARHGIGTADIFERWVDEDDLLLDVLLDGPGRSIAPPDTGSLRDDLTLVAMAMAAYISTDKGRSLQGTLLIGNRDRFRVDVRAQVWQRRSAVMAAVFDRAVARGEMRADIDPRLVLQMVVAPINMRVLFNNDVADESYCRTLVDLVCRAVAL